MCLYQAYEYAFKGLHYFLNCRWSLPTVMLCVTGDLLELVSVYIFSQPYYKRTVKRKLPVAAKKINKFNHFILDYLTWLLY